MLCVPVPHFLSCPLLYTPSMSTMHLKTNYARNKNALESIKRFDAFSLYVYAVFIGFWVFFKWFVSYLWFMVHSNSIRTRYTEEKSKSPVHQNFDQPPPFVVDNYFGRHSYIKVKVYRDGPPGRSLLLRQSPPVLIILCEMTFLFQSSSRRAGLISVTVMQTQAAGELCCIW